MFVANYEQGQGYCGWDLLTPLVVGVDDWAYNEVELLSDESAWARYSNERSLEHVLTRAGFIGVRYAIDHGRGGVGATGALGIDEFAYDLR